MKWKNVIVPACFLASLGASLFGAAARLRQVDPPAGRPDLTVTAVLPFQYGYWAELQEGMASAAERENISIRTEYPQMAYSSSQMASLVSQAAAAGVDAIITQGVDDSDFKAAVSSAQDQGIWIAFVDTDLPETRTHLYVGTDNYQAGYQMAQELVRIRQGSGGVSVLCGDTSLPGITQRLEGFREGIREYEQMHIERIEETRYDVLQILDRFETLCEDPGTDAIIFLDGTGGNALGTELNTLNSHGKTIICFDMTNYTQAAILNGTIEGAIVQEPAQMGNAVVNALYGFHQTGAFESRTIYTDISFVTAKTLEEASS